MKLRHTAAFLFLVGLMSNSFAQDYTVKFLKGARDFEANIETFNPADIEENQIWNTNYYQFVQFFDIPSEADQAKLSALGIELLEYVPNYTYVASIPVSLTQAELAQLNIRSIQSIDRVYRQSQRIQDENYPDWATTKFNTVLLSLSFYDNVNFDAVIADLKKQGVTCKETLNHAKMVFVEVEASSIGSLLDLTYLKYLDAIPDPGTPESDDGRILHRANAIDGDYYGSRDYDGTGISIAINDDGFVGPHIDFTGRVNQDDVAGDFVGNHGDMVAGIAGGAGNLDPNIRGMATGSYMHIRQYVSSMAGTIPLYVDSNVLVFSSSYSNGCNAGYTNTTVLVDEEIYNNPNLMQVFSAGNSNNNDCGYGAGSQWGNITGGHKMGKNVIATANLSSDDLIVNSSSRGPASDGRIKPDIAAHGASQMSTDPDNGYAPGGGTSAAAPGISGVFAQLHQAYSELNGGQTAESALLKATLLNTANDLGNDGPDFTFGWGKVNGLKAVKLLEDNRYLNGMIAQGATNNHTIAVPAGVERVKIMVYWADKEASTVSATALVNDLDAFVTDPTNGTHLPWLLDHTPNAGALATPATTGVDHLNNVEQIAIDNPAAGNYDLEISGFNIPFGPQEYYVVYEFISSEITVIHPMGGEGLDPGTTERIHWDANGTAGDFTLEYTLNNGASWNTISSTVNGDERFYSWTVPASITGEARVRVSRGGDSDESDANFSIMERPENIEVDRICADINTIVLKWDPVPGATEYNVFMLGTKFMDSIGTSSTTDFDAVVTDIADPQWFSVRAVGANGMRSTRQIAIYFPGGGGNGNCYLSCYSDADVGISSLNEPAANFQSCSGSNTSDVVINLENLGLNTESGFPMYYQLDNGAVISETYSGSLAPGANDLYTFSTQVTFPSNGTYQLKTWTGLSGDSTFCNDTITTTITVINSLSNFPIVEDFEGSIFPPSVIEVINGDLDLTWEPANTTGASGAPTTAAFINNFSYNASGQEDEMNFVNFDLSQVQNPATAILTFDVAYREYSSSYTDEMRIDASDDCGVSYNQVYYKDGPTLTTGGYSTSNWEPSSAGDWRNDTIDLSAYVGGNVSLKFVNICGYGNNLYLDNINLTVQSFASVDELNNDFQVSIMPNPASEETTLQFAKALTEETTLTLVSLDGKVLLSEVLEKGSISKTIDVSALKSAVYLVHLSSTGSNTVKKIVVSD